jgi:alginate O-acetyltransferase complex protein AlgI
MLFNSFIFLWLFLPLVIFLNFLVLKLTGSSRLSNILLLLASVFFYAWGEPIYVILLLLSIFINWTAGMLIDAAKHKRLVLAAAVVLNLGILGYYKYADMLIHTVNQIAGTGFPEPQIPIPIGVSFYTLSALSYVIDLYRNKCEKQRNILKLALYLSFFPKVIAGPIVSYREAAKQIDHRTISASQTAEGIRRFIYGLGKKVLISDVLTVTVDKIYAMDPGSISGSLAWIASLFFTLQIYYDFSGYSDMAIGLGKIFGFEFKENFDYPYLSHSIRDFWRRWHISLGSWLKEYLYIPMGGNRHGRRRTCINLIVVFFLAGLWHGSSWHFAIWGLVNVLFVIIERMGFEKILKKHKIISWIYSFLVVNFTWILFRIPSLRQGLRFIKRMILPWHYPSGNLSVWHFMSYHTVFIAVIGFAGMGLLQLVAKKSAKAGRWKHSFVEYIFCTLILVLSIAGMADGTYHPFLYFRF